MYKQHVEKIIVPNKYSNLITPLAITVAILFLQAIIDLILLLIFSPIYTKIVGFDENTKSIEIAGSNSISGVLSMIIGILIIVYIANKSSDLKTSGLGFSKTKLFPTYLKGYFIGTFLITIIFIILKLSKTINFEYNFNKKFLIFIVGSFLFFIFQGLYEEVLVRGYLMTNFSALYGDKFAIIFSSAIFSVLHLLNPGVNKIAVLNLFLAGIFFSLLYRATGNILFVGAVHSSWNFVQGIIFGSLVSGYEIKYSVFKSIPLEDNALIHGGDFGFEGSIATTVLLGVLIIYLILTRNKKLWNI
ncbi:CPBP family intramembrane glutamic endopeptidase [Gemelliphila palaticanis]|uniref:CPBP family intramembrane metalloprotease n=1 Tax=Gemelliphila palaticanis TaxID=81950 RepID=A0ABX2SX90_9BACL|nr:CPBP family intramembrane glutamic endopeptidase [Gemella palaticanis]MBF0714784.1 CPBP family intramembrane metalloprotease [Gemella palaticanis]NYS46714.1 CPBP family intramembrane metalloprotease [Gemella palaticanis]